MKQGDTVGGYQVVTEPTNAGGGKCMWAFAEKNGKQYFLKEFLTPTRPLPGVGSAGRRVAMEAVCKEFEDRHRGIMARLRPDMPGGGHLVLAEAFFGEGTSYYKVTKRIDTSSLDRPQRLEVGQKRVLLKSLAVSVRLLHDIGVVHGDLKPDNVLVQKMAGNAFHIAKLIDFDDSYLSGQPSGRTDVAGDSQYGAPEWRRYVQGDEATAPEALTTAVDLFAFGLLTHYYLTGALPRLKPGFGAAADAVNAGEQLGLDRRLTDPMRKLLRSMLMADPAARPAMSAVLAALDTPDICALRHPRPAAPSSPAPAPAPSPAPAPASVRSPEAATGRSGAGTGKASRVEMSISTARLPAPAAAAKTPAAPAKAPPAAPAPAPAKTPAEPATGRTSRVRIYLDRP